MPALGYNKGRSRQTQCLANLQQLGRAWFMYANDNRGKVVWNPEGGDAGKVASKPSWCGGGMDLSNNNPNNTNLAYLISYDPPHSYGGLLAAYLSGPSAFRCPEDPSTVIIYGQQKLRVRSVSMNSYVGGRTPDGITNYWSFAPFKSFLTINDFSNLKPASAFVFVDQREDGIGDSTFRMNLVQCLDNSDNVVNSGLRFVDYPADWHDGGAGISFADGHAETWRWTDPRTSPLRGPSFQFVSGLSPNNQDVARLAKATSSH